MNFLHVSDFGLIWAVNVLVQVTIIGGFATLLAMTVRKSPMARHWILLPSLLLILLSPVLTLWLPRPVGRWLSVQLDNAPVRAESTRSVEGREGDIPWENPLSPMSGFGPERPMKPKGGTTSRRSEEFEIVAETDSNDSSDSNAAAPLSAVEKPQSKQAARVVLSQAELSDRQAVSKTWAGRVLRTVVLPVVGVWLCGALVLLLRLAIGYWRLSRVLRAARPLNNEDLRAILRDLRRELGLTCLPEVLESDRISSPITAGFVCPRVILPDGFSGAVSESQLREILIHELAHVVRRDQWVVLLQNVAGCCFWLHPLVRFLNQQLARAREEICDNYVLSMVDAAAYSHTLLLIARSISTPRVIPGTAGLFTSGWTLEERITGLLDSRRNRDIQLTSWRSMGIAAVTMSIVFLIACCRISIAENDQKQAQKDAGAAAPKDQPANDVKVEKPKAAEDDAGTVALNLVVRMPDGTPAAGASVESNNQKPDRCQVVRADQAGRAVVRDTFGNGAKIHASSADRQFQATLREEAAAIRKAFKSPIEVTLAAAKVHTVTVLLRGKPVNKTQVVLQGHFFRVFGETGPDGVAIVKIPADDVIVGVAAFHPQLGVAGIHSWDGIKDSTQLSLHDPTPLVIRLIDSDGRPMPQLQMRVGVVVNRDWILSQEFPDATVESDDRGEARVSWIPGDNLKRIEVEPIGSDWKVDESDHERLAERIVTIKVSRMRRVIGRLVLPDGADPEGTLIVGHGFGHGHHGDYFEARARRDGFFVGKVGINHGYAVGVFDNEWTSNPWSGTVVKTDQDQPAKISIPVERATPLTVVVTRGTDRTPVAGAWIDLQRYADFEWTDAAGEKHNAGGRVGGWLKTDSTGRAYCGVFRGENDVRVSIGTWDEQQKLKVSSEDPVKVEFHREWLNNRIVVARMTRNGQPFQPSAKIKTVAWTNMLPRVGPVHKPVVNKDRIEVTFDEKLMELVAFDPEHKLSGYLKVGADEQDVELEMQPTATYEGTLRDGNGEAIPNRAIRLLTAVSFLEVSEPQKTDGNGKFQFSSVPVQTKLILSMQDEQDLPKYALFESRYFEPGEVRNDKDLRASRQDQPVQTAQPKRSLAERVQSTCDNVRAAGMHAVVILRGDATEAVRMMVERIVDYDNDVVMPWLPVDATAEQVTESAKIITEKKWPMPKAREISLIALDGHQKILGSVTISVGNDEQANEFLKKHQPVFEDARVKLTRANETAKRDGRRVWLIVGGPRCGPCFRLAKWIEQYHELLEKDFVIVKVMEGVEKNADEINKEIGGEEHGIPWFVFQEPDGKVLITSESPVGNIGMPSSVEEIRHFRKMLEQSSRKLTKEEIDQLIRSLSSK